MASEQGQTLPEKLEPKEILALPCFPRLASTPQTALLVGGILWEKLKPNDILVLPFSPR